MLFRLAQSSRGSWSSVQEQTRHVPMISPGNVVPKYGRPPLSLSGRRLSRRRSRRTSQGKLLLSRKTIRHHLRLCRAHACALPLVPRVPQADGHLRRYLCDGHAEGNGGARPIVCSAAGEVLETFLARWYASTIQIRTAARPQFSTWPPLSLSPYGHSGLFYLASQIADRMTHNIHILSDPLFFSIESRLCKVGCIDPREYVIINSFLCPRQEKKKKRRHPRSPSC